MNKLSTGYAHIAGILLVSSVRKGGLNEEFYDKLEVNPVQWVNGASARKGVEMTEEIRYSHLALDNQIDELRQRIEQHSTILQRHEQEVLILVTARRLQAELIRDLTTMIMRYNSMMLARDQQLRTLQGVVGNLQQDIVTLEEKFILMEKVLNVEVIPHIQDIGFEDIDVEQEYQRQESPESRKNGYGAEL